jgi:hypothetical protein
MKTVIALSMLLFVASAFCAGKAVACGEANGKMRVYSSTDNNGITYELILDAAALEHSPTWVPGDKEPPLSAAKVVTLVTAWAKQRYPSANEIRVRSIDLESFQCTFNHHWYYRVELMLIANGKSMTGIANFAGMMMDGTIVEPTLSK